MGFVITMYLVSLMFVSMAIDLSEEKRKMNVLEQMSVVIFWPIVSFVVLLKLLWKIIKS